MKRVCVLVAAMGLIALAGCAKQAPEDVAKHFVERQIATQHEGFILDASDLDYKVVEKGEDFARVLVAGEIDVKGEIPLVKTGGKWVIGAKPARAPKPGAPAAKSAPAGEKTGSPEGHK